MDGKKDKYMKKNYDYICKYLYNYSHIIEHFCKLKNTATSLVYCVVHCKNKIKDKNKYE